MGLTGTRADLSSQLLTGSQSGVTIGDRVTDRKGTPMAPPHDTRTADSLAQVQRAAAAHASTRERLEQRIRAASAAGAALRTIAAAAGVSHEQVRRIVAAGERHA